MLHIFNLHNFIFHLVCVSCMFCPFLPNSRSIYGAVSCTEQAEFPYAERFSYLLDVLSNASTSEEKEPVHISTNCNDQDR